MKNLKFLILPLLFLFVVSCGGIDASEELGKKYHDALIEKDYDAITSEMISMEGLHASSKSEWNEVFDFIHSFGEIEKVEKQMGFNSNSANGQTYVTLNYTIHYKDGGEVKELYEKIIFIKNANNPDHKIYTIAVNIDKNRLKDM